jgi:Di-haem cytochrome c peroxidase
MPEMGFTGPVSELNRTTGSYPGSVRTRFSNRKPQSHAYAPLSPVLHYNPGQDDLVGGNFWDMRATGRRLGNPAAEQAEGPPTNPVEMGLPDSACAVYRASQRPYRGLFEQVWGGGAFSIQWPDEVEQVCNQPGPPPANDLMPIHLSDVDRSRAAATFDQMALSIASYEASGEVTSLTSKFDAVLAGKTQLTPQEQTGYALFRGKAQQDRRMSTPVLPAFCARISCSVTRRRSMHAGYRSRPTIRVAFRCRRYGMWTNGPIQVSSRLIRTMAISKISNRSCITTTRGTCCRAASRTIGARVQHAGRRRSRPTT